MPRAIPRVGLIGAPLLITSTIAVLFGIIEPISAWSAIATLPVALWGFSLGVWLTFKGFKPCAVTPGLVRAGSTARLGLGLTTHPRLPRIRFPAVSDRSPESVDGSTRSTSSPCGSSTTWSTTAPS